MGPPGGLEYEYSNNKCPGHKQTASNDGRGNDGLSQSINGNQW